MNTITQPQENGTGRSRGRPRSSKPLTATTILLSKHHRELARRFGDGKLVDGVRRALEALDRAQFQAQVPQEPSLNGDEG